ncbi:MULTISPECIES: ABC transporter substrate-binding protein [unclassified Cobetia]|uniref:ABC transporter substrate-binding protein n=1 Tax=unclassified Cobetia TaxID=2609414 RepID=UPI00178C9B9F|nr:MULTISPECIES: ABC transporter substrate-binding protein [unclassified Cobetia]MBE2167491.1 ABC transporter substrate-binding protein [Cobetia sp. 2AS1]MDH2447065.1 ABC transporter substrate-binding protein [Cobetia sp. 2AS]
MNKSVRTATTLAACIVSSLALTNQAQASCELDETIQIADMSWVSASTIAHIEAKILENGFECKTQLIPGETVTTATTMVKKGRPHIAPELWSSNAKALLEEGAEKGTAVVAGDVFAGGGVDAWWVPRYIVDQYPDIKSVEDMARHSELFAANGSDKGRFYNSIPGWTTETRSTNLMHAYGLDDKYEVFSAGSGAALDAAIVSNYKRKKPIFFYYWGPSAILGKYDMVQLDMAPYDPANDSCNAEQNCKNPTTSGFRTAAVNTLVANNIKDNAPSIYQFLSKVQFENDMVNTLLAWNSDNDADPEQTAEHFLKTQQAIWTAWVPAEVAEKVIAKLK